MHNADFAALSDEQLAYALRQLELKLASLRYRTSASGQVLYQEFLEEHTAAWAEQERRKV
jgi:ribosomal protein L29